jgi:hypothetical protein
MILLAGLNPEQIDLKAYNRGEQIDLKAYNPEQIDLEAYNTGEPHVL